MFQFDFVIDADPEIDELLNLNSGGTSTIIARDAEWKRQCEAESFKIAPFIEHTLDDLLETLPHAISFSPIQIPTESVESPISLSKRDLFDARFQLIASSPEQHEQEPGLDAEDLKFIEAPSDLIPGVYEGGLKTWECSVDLAGYLHNTLTLDALFGKRVLELGCGTAIPSMYLLRKVFDHPSKSNDRTILHLQDFNELVFRLSVLPNLILTWYMSAASATFREQAKQSQAESDDILPPCDPSQPGDLSITPDILSAFRHSLVEHHVEIRFFSGSWENFDLHKSGGGKYDVVLTSETIYRTDSLPSLLDLMWRAVAHRSSRSVETPANKSTTTAEQSTRVVSRNALSIVAAKLVYFGVGGGVSEFVDAVEGAQNSKCSRQSGTIETAWRNDEGVKRVIMKVQWE